MFVHVKYGNECRDRTMEFNNDQFVTVNDITEKVRHTYGEYSTLQLLNEPGRELNLQAIVENAMVYIVRRRPFKELRPKTSTFFKDLRPKTSTF